ncbi:hypothetical protein F4604DRAFT_1684477 [Suillus subluteus]|nr:hypothetical protein F4604DRAFT_1684477 [Suillus subluteus]
MSIAVGRHEDPSSGLEHESYVYDPEFAGLTMLSGLPTFTINFMGYLSLGSQPTLYPLYNHQDASLPLNLPWVQGNTGINGVMHRVYCHDSVASAGVQLNIHKIMRACPKWRKALAYLRLMLRIRKILILLSLPHCLLKANVTAEELEEGLQLNFWIQITDAHSFLDLTMVTKLPMVHNEVLLMTNMPPGKTTPGTGPPKSNSPTQTTAPSTRKTVRSQTTVEEIMAIRSTVMDTESAEAYLESKLLCQVGQPYTLSHLSTILFHITQMSTVTPVPVNAAIRAVAFLLKKQIIAGIHVASESLAETAQKAENTLIVTLDKAERLHRLARDERTEQEGGVSVASERLEETADALYATTPPKTASITCPSNCPPPPPPHPPQPNLPTARWQRPTSLLLWTRLSVEQLLGRAKSS